MKKYLSIFLSLAVMVNILSIPAGALSSTSPMEMATFDSENIASQVVLRKNPNGTYTLVNDSALSAFTVVSNSSNTDDLVYASTERDTDILRLHNGQYLTTAYNNTYVPAERIDINTSDFGANYSIFEKYDIPEESIMSLKDAIDSQREIGNSDFEFSYYISEPFVVPTSTSSVQPTASNSNVIVTQTGEARNYMSPHVSISKGVSTKNVAASIKSLTVSAIGAASTSFSILSSGISVLKAYESYINRTVTVPLSSDWQEIQFKYDWLEKTARVHTTAGNLIGCVAQKIWINTVYYEQFYANYKNAVLAKSPSSNGVYKTSHYVNKVAKTKSWDNIEKVALYNWTTPVRDQPLKTTIAGVTYVFKKS